MKMFLLLVVSLLLSPGASVGIVQAQVPPPRQQAELRTHPNRADYGKFDGRGRLVFQELYQDDASAEWYATLVYYPQGSSQGVKLHRNITAVNVFLTAEIRQPQTVHSFLDEHLWRFLSDNLGDVPTLIITPLGKDENVDDYLVEADRHSATKRERLQAKLQNYMLPGKVVVVGGSWTMDANVITSHGAVEHWSIKGQVAPMRIDSFLCESKEPEGTFKQPLIWLR